MRRAAPNKQGYLDGLCGIYALTNFLRDLCIERSHFLGGTHQERSDRAFWLMLDTAERERMLTADFIIQGYAAHHLVQIWNTLSNGLGLGLTAVVLTKLRRLARKPRTSLIFSSVLEEDFAPQAALILHEEHWYLCYSMNEAGNFTVLDSASDSPGESVLTKGKIDAPEIDGLVILSDRSKILATVRGEL